jgi:hypothetical protein
MTKFMTKFMTGFDVAKAYGQITAAQAAPKEMRPPLRVVETPRGRKVTGTMAGFKALLDAEKKELEKEAISKNG